MRFVIGAIVVIGLWLVMMNNLNKPEAYHPPPAPASYSVGTICFDDGAGGISNPDECLP
jgi:hypothetical protein